MEQTPVHENHNPELLGLVPRTAQALLEVGCSSGALAREFKKINPSCDYFGIDIDPGYIELAKRHCDGAIALDIENADDAFFDRYRDRDTWIFGDTLEHFKDPWRILRQIRRVIPRHGCVVACIPNAQHWSVQVRLSIGDFRYEPSGLLDRTHLRWFTRQTIMELFSSTGFAVNAGVSRVGEEPDRERFLPVIGEMARLAGTDAKTAMEDAWAIQYVVRATPV